MAEGREILKKEINAVESGSFW